MGGQAHLLWLKEAIEAAGVKAPVLGGLPMVCLQSWFMFATCKQSIRFFAMGTCHSYFQSSAGLQDAKVVIEERYLGLHSPGDDGVPPNVIANLATIVETHLDLDAIVQVLANRYSLVVCYCDPLPYTRANNAVPSGIDEEVCAEFLAQIASSAHMPSAPVPLQCAPSSSSSHVGQVLIGVARDAAFSFYYYE